MRGTFTHRNPDFTKDIQTMLDLGFDELSMEPVVCPPTDKYALTEDDKKVIFKEYEKLADMMIERRKQCKPFTFYHYMLNLEGGPCIYKRISGCGSGTEYLAVTPTGELYPCHQFVGNKEYLMGDIWKGVTNLDIQSKFKNATRIRERSATIAGQGSIARAVARQTHTTQPGTSTACTHTVATFLKSV